MDLTFEILDEIALEGLDGITIETLWIRLQERPNFLYANNLDDDVKEYIWKLVRGLRDVEFYVLPEPRRKFDPNERYHVEPDIGVVTEISPPPEDIYPHELVNDTVNKVVGSCVTYYSRKNVSTIVRRCNLKVACSVFENRLVVVANQAVRWRALIGMNLNPNIDVGGQQYSLLERIGRSRYRGELTQGRTGLQMLCDDTKTVFYYRKNLLKYKLITKQPTQIKLLGTNVSGLMLHLTRFYNLVKPKVVTLTEIVVKFLKTKPNGMSDYKELHELLKVPGILRRLTKVIDFQKFVRTDVHVPYRTLYPDADVRQWKRKVNDKEKVVKVIQLRDPSIEVKDIYKTLMGSADDEEDDDELLGLFSDDNRYIDVSLFNQNFMFLKNGGKFGFTQTDIADHFGLTRVQARTISKNLVRTGAVGTFLTECGKQRVGKFYLKDNKEVNDEVLVSKRMSEIKSSEDFRNVLPCRNNSSTSSGNVTLDKSFSSSSLKFGSLKDISTNISDETPKIRVKNFAAYNKANKRKSDSNNLNGDSSSSNKKPKIIFNNNLTNDDKHGNSSVAIIDGAECDNLENINGNLVNENKSDSSVKRKFSVGTSDEEIINIKKRKTDVSNKGIVEENPLDMESIKSDLTAIIKKAVENNSGDSICQEITKDDKIGKSAKKVDESKLIEKIEIDVSVNEDFNWLLRKDELKNELTRLKQNNYIACKSLKTYRLLKRSNLILETVYEHKVLTELRKLVIIINEAEYREGHPTVMDKKSLYRILFRLAVDKHIKIYRATLKHGQEERYLEFICDNDVEPNHPAIESSVELARLKFQISLVHSTVGTEDNKIKRLEEFEKKKNASNFPKFNRMKIIHHFLFYLVYDYQGNENQDQSDALSKIEKDYHLSDELKDSMSFIYYPKIEWKMFVPPLPNYPKETYGENSGWSLLSDVLVRMPLSIFSQLVFIPYYCPDLDLYLKHPIKQHCLMSKLPAKFRNALMGTRKYVYSILDVMTKLVYVGLLQFGPHKQKNKEVAFTYVNRHATLLDTTLSKPGYNKITPNIEYPVKNFTFNNLHDVEKYWLTAMNICLNTNLGGRHTVIGTDVILENLQDKYEMILATKHREFDEAVEYDTGYLPGDKSGAAGYDSAMFAHLKRNWQTNTINSVKQMRTPLLENRSDLVNFPNDSQPINSRTQLLQLPKPMNTNVLKKKRKQMISSLPSKISIIKKKRIRPVKVRHIKPVKSNQRKPYYDQVDREALKKMNKLRVDWSKEEDRVLLICKIASSFICPDTRKQINANLFQAYREVLHKMLEQSKNKTSRACQRRVAYMLKSPDTTHSLNLCIEELRHDKEIVKKYGDTVEYIRNAVKNEGKKIKDMGIFWKTRFQELVDHLMQKYDYNSENLSFKTKGKFSPLFVIPDTLKKFTEQYQLVPIKNTNLHYKGKFESVKHLHDIYVAVLYVTIHSMLCCNSDNVLWSYHLYNIYKQYPEKFLRNTLLAMRSNQMVSIKKSCQKKQVNSNRYLPLYAEPYQLSITYVNLMQMKYQFEMFLEAYKFFSDLVKGIKNLKDDEKGYKVLSLNGGSTAVMVGLYSDDTFTFTIGIPDQIIILDPNVKNKDENYTRLVENYKKILMRYNRDLTTSVLFQKENYATGTDMSGDISSLNDSKIVKKESPSAQTTVAKAASRIALYLLRDDNAFQTSIPKEMDHAHDFFVINSCDIYVKFNKPLDKLNLIGNEEVRVLIKKLQENCFFDHTVSKNLEQNIETIDDVLGHKFDVDNITYAKRVLKEIESKNKFGLTSDELVKSFGNSFSLVDVINKLIELNLVVQTGVCKTRFVHHSHVEPWLLHSYRSICRSETLKKSDQNSNKNENLDYIDEESNSPDTEIPSTSKDLLQNKSIISDPNAGLASEKLKNLIDNNYCNTDSNLSDDQILMIDPKIDEDEELAQGITDEDYKKLIDKSMMSDPIKVIMSPWIRIDGTLNRRVFDSVLSSVLSHIMLNPGISLLDLQNRFSPAYHPYHVREVCKYLIELKCINRYEVKTMNKPTLFSKSSCQVIINKNPTGLEPDINIRYEATKFSIINISKFLENKPYSQNLLSSIMNR